MVLNNVPEASPAFSMVARQAALFEAAVPALVLLAVFVALLTAYTVRGRVVGEYHDEEMDHRGVGGLTSRRVRHFFAWSMRPLWRGLAALSVPPNAITMLNLGLSLTTGVAAATGHFALAGWMFMAGGVLDFLDGRLARETGKASRSGAALDSVVDRYSESALLVGLCWYYGGSWVLGVALLALTGSLLVPYVRARSESLGVTIKDVGIMQRPERVLLLGPGVAFAPVVQAMLAPDEAVPSYHLAILALAALAVLSHWTAAQRLAHLVRALNSEALGLRAKMAPRTLAVGAFTLAFDYSIMHALVACDLLPAPAATGRVCVAGGLVAFAPTWSALGPATRRTRAKRAAFVVATSALLNAGGVALAAVLARGLDYRLAWLIVRAVVLAAWNLPLLPELRLEAARDPLLDVTLPKARAPALARAARVRRSDAHIASL